MNKTLITIVAPVYKTEKFLDKCIKSVLRQTFKDWELILVNDCSPDNSKAKIERYTRKYENIRLINHKENKGVDFARHTGINESRGDYLMFIDSDDWFHKNALAKLYDSITKESADLAFGSYCKVFDQHRIFSKKISSFLNDKESFKTINQPELFDKYFISFFGVNLFPVSMSGKLYKKEVVLKANIEPENFRMGEDLTFNMKLHPFLSKVSFTDQVIFYYRFGGVTSTSNPNFLNNIKEQYALKKLYLDKYKYSKGYSSSRLEVINCFYSHYLNLNVLDNLSLDDVKLAIEKELKDEFYDDILSSPITFDRFQNKIDALMQKDTDKIVDIIRDYALREKKYLHLKRSVSKVLNFI